MFSAETPPASRFPESRRELRTLFESACTLAGLDLYKDPDKLETLCLGKTVKSLLPGFKAQPGAALAGVEILA